MTKSSRTLTLRKELLTDLGPDQLRGVSGGTTTALTGPLCVTQWLTVCRECPSDGCPSDPLTDCTVIHPTQPNTCIC